MNVFDINILLNHERKKMNPFVALTRFLEGKPGSLRWGSLSVSEEVGDLRYRTIADGKRDMRGDLRRLGSDWKRSVDKLSENGKKSRTE